MGFDLFLSGYVSYEELVKVMRRVDRGEGKNSKFGLLGRVGFV